jgi:hypothetical protein
MSAARRRIIRPSVSTTESSVRLKRRAKLLARVECDQAALTRWLSRLKRSFHQVEKLQVRLTRLRNQISKLENPPCQKSSR